ncbi:hypothetical protein SRHO_G00098450 [Serrasalmus rhombeus]
MAEDVPKERASLQDSQTYYLPHHAVLRKDKATTKLRVVFDASSHEEGSPSLNDCLLTGPNLNPDLMSVLIKFRLHEVAYMADIKKAFLQISLTERDRDAPEPLTPAHFLVGQRLTCLPPKSFPAEINHQTANKEEMTKRWRYRQRLVTNFWNRWQKSSLKIGDVALIGEDNAPRQSWKLGKIEELFPGRDGLVRSCAIRTSTGTVLRRPIQLLYPLEIV